MAIGTNGKIIFAGMHNRILGERVCKHIGCELGNSTTTLFPDGEILVKLEEDVRGKDCYVIISSCNPVNDNLMELFVFIDCLRRASAKQVVAVMPYYGYGRQDRKSEGRTPITAKLVANMITSAGADRVLAIDLHAAQIQGFFDIPVDHLHASPVFMRYFESIREELGDLCLVSPDVGNVKVAEAYANELDADLAIINKKRISGTQVSMGQIIGEVKDKNILMVDDMISTAGTVDKAARLVLEQGAKSVRVAATHPLFINPAIELLSQDHFTQIISTDTIPSGNRPDVIEKLGDRYVELSVSELLGEAIIRIHEERSISALLKGGAGAKR